MLMNYAHSINTSCGVYEAMDTLYLEVLLGGNDTLNHRYADGDLYHTATAQNNPLSPDTCV